MGQKKKSRKAIPSRTSYKAERKDITNKIKKIYKGWKQGGFKDSKAKAWLVGAKRNHITNYNAAKKQSPSMQDRL